MSEEAAASAGMPTDEAEVAFPPMPDIGGRMFLLRGVAGAQATLGGLWFTLKRSELRWLAIATIAIYFVCFGLLLAGGWVALPFVVDRIGFESALWKWVVGIALAVGWLLASVVLALILGSVLSSELLARLGKRTERLLTGSVAEDGTGLIGGVVDAMKEAVYQLSLVVPVALALFLIGLIPVAGTIAALVLGWVWSSMWVSLSFVTPTATRHGLKAKERLKFVFGNKSLFIGFGGVQALVPFLLVPLFAPALAVAGTRIFLLLAAHDRVASKLDPETKRRLIAREESDALPADPAAGDDAA